MKALAVAALFLALLVVPPTRIDAAANPASLTYHWPIKPFNQQHPVRGAFGDPRTISDQPLGSTGRNQVGAYSFHNGIDIVAPPGTPVYPVVSGRIVKAGAEKVVVHTRDRRTFQYYHLDAAPALRVGKAVVAARTVLGWIRPQWEHVHLAEIDGSVIHNPLDPGHLEPYSEGTRPVASELYVDDGSVGAPLHGRSIGPGDRLAVSATDSPALAMPGLWDGLPQAPALVEWRLFQGRTSTAWKIAVDFRHTQPAPRYFWEVYGAGTYQNCPTFADRIYPGIPGRYLFRLHIHPARLQPGPYRLAVRVTDTHGNRSTARWPLVIAD